jgi:hypothetical protein
MFTIFSERASIHFSVFRATLQSVSGSVFATDCSVLCFTNSRTRFRCDVMFENEHVLFVNTPYSHLLSVCIWREQWPSNKGVVDSSVKGEAGGVYYTGMDLLLIEFFTVVRNYCWIAFYGTSCTVLVY